MDYIAQFRVRSQKKYDNVTMLHSKSLKKCHKKSKNWLTNIHVCQKIILNSAIPIVKMSAREVTIFPKKNLN